MKRLRIPLRVVFYQDAGEWVAHCLEFDLMGDGETKEEAIHALSKAIRFQLEASIEYDNPQNLFSPADGRYFEMFAAGMDLALGELELQVPTLDTVEIKDIEYREYSDAEPLPA